jgi:hypothetical protein
MIDWSAGDVHGAAERLHRRGTAKRCIGVAYRVIAASPAARALLDLMGLTEP